MNETKVYSRASVFDWLGTQAAFVPEAAIALMWVRNPDRLKSEPRPYLLRARVAGDTLRDLIEALQQLDPDLKHGVEEVVRTSCGSVDGLNDPNLTEEIETLRAALEEIADEIAVETVERARAIATEALL